GSKVREIQKTLADQGYPCSTNGVFDRATEEAVRLFQQAKGLKADGVVGSRTLAALSGKLDDQLNSPETAISTNSLDEENENSEDKSTKETWKLGDRDSKVSEIQKTLTAAGLQPGADGVFDAKTEEAVRQFQRDQGLNVDGIVGPRTLAALSQKPEPQQSMPEPQQSTPEAQQSTPELKEEPAPDPKKAISWYSIEEPVKPVAEESAKKTWQLGDRNSKVSEIQKSLTTAGFKPGADGVFDEQTQDAVRQFQQSKGLKADGVVGPRTLTALSQPPEPTKTNPWYEDESAPLSPFTR
ncbi:MAG TPA: peptidoglycan-binding protein, partial [Coleofasciculaceae cyanobacterium]